MSSQVLLGASLSLIAASLYAFIGRRLGGREVPNPDDQLAWLAFRVWWYALAASTLLSVITTLFAGLGAASILLYQVLSLLNLLSLSIALWGLLYYLVYVYTGRQTLAVPIGVFYFLCFVSLVAFIIYLNPVGVEMGDWSATILYERQAGPAYVTLLLFALILPPLLASLAMLALAFRVADRSQKYRSSLVSLGIIIWFGVSLLASLLGLNELPLWPLMSRFISLAAALIILWAYFPPPFIRTRLKVSGI
jgi:hypothetical protein